MWRNQLREVASPAGPDWSRGQMSEHTHVERYERTRQIATARLVLRPWRLDDDVAACAIYQAAEVTRWLSPTLPVIEEPAEMRAVLERWISEDDATGPPL